MRKAKSKGVSLLEVTIAASLLALVSLAAARALKTMFSGAKGAQLAAVRDRIFDRIERAGLQPANLSRSAAANAELLNCMAASGAQDCVLPVANGGWQEFRLLDASQPVGAIALAGTVAQPIFYDTDGNPCFNPAPTFGKCVFEARSYFQPQCEAFPCDQALTIAVRTLVLPRAGSGVELAARTSAMRAPMSTREVRSLGAKVCAPGTRPEGTDKYGNPLCVPETQSVCQNVNDPNLNSPNQFPYYIDFGNKVVSCKQLTLAGSCPPGQYSTGYQPNGDAKCEKILDRLPGRVDVYLGNRMNLFACGAGLAVGTVADNGSPICEDQRFYFRDVIYPYKTVGFSVFPTYIAGQHGTMGDGPPAMVPGTQTMNWIIPGNPDITPARSGTPFNTEQISCWVNGAGWFKGGNTYALMNCQNTANIQVLGTMNYWDPDPGGFTSIGSFGFFQVGKQNDY